MSPAESLLKYFVTIFAQPTVNARSESLLWTWSASTPRTVKSTYSYPEFRSGTMQRLDPRSAIMCKCPEIRKTRATFVYNKRLSRIKNCKTEFELFCSTHLSRKLAKVLHPHKLFPASGDATSGILCAYCISRCSFPLGTLVDGITLLVHLEQQS